MGDGTALIDTTYIDNATSALVADARGGTSMVPASNMKVLTTGAALHVLGADWSFRTRLLRDGDRLTVVGDGDPSLGDPALDGARTTEQLMDGWVAAVRAAGVRRVRELVADDRILDREFTHPSWPADQLNASYCAQVAGLNIHENLLGFVLAASGGKPAVVRTEPASSWVSVETGRATARSGKGTEQTIGIAPNLAAVGVKREQIGRLVELAVKDICHQTNPRKVEAADFERFFNAAF